MFNTIVGQAAENEHYYNRAHLDTKFWKAIRSGSHVLVSAPRRIGKTSFLKNVVNKGQKGYIIKYHITESINDSNEFFKRLYKSLLHEISKKDQWWENAQEFIKKNQIKKIGLDGFEIGKEDLNYFDEFKRIFNRLESDQKFLFIVDEFSETLENIIQDQGEEAGKLFLHQNRELRQEPDLNRKVQFVYCGSIGLENIAERIGVIKNINDLRNFPIPPFSGNEALNLIESVKTHEQIEFSIDTQRYLFGEIRWLIPFYIQIILDEIENILLINTSQKVTAEIVDQAITNAIEVRMYFEHWFTRLRTTFKGDDYSFALALLNAISTSNDQFTTAKVFDLAVKYNLEEQYKSVTRILKYDGYIHTDEQNHLSFNSPLLKIWWKRNIAS